MALDFQSAALAYVSLGLRVFPLVPQTKRPLIKAWPQHASGDTEIIAAWAHRWPNANIAIACGRRSAVMVVDVDAKCGRDGRQALEKHAAAGRRLPPCPTAMTPTGGVHLFFCYEEGLRNGAGLTRNGRGMGDGIDFRGEGGYVAAAPSVVDGKAYRWRIPPLSPEFPRLPEWAVACLAPRRPKFSEFAPHDRGNQAKKKLESLAEFVASQKEGQRNNVLYWAVRRSIDEGVAAGAIRDRFFEAGIAAGLPPNEINATILSALKSASSNL
ncbi:MAG: bifunctional DNA primase/polymerase [Hyphomicrobiaceae bacterium]